MYFLKFLYSVIYKSLYIYFSQKKQQKWGTDYLNKLQNEFGGAFDKRTYDKIIFYYSLKIPAICDAFLGLQQRTTNEEECKRLLNYFICSSVFDNFFDRFELTDEQIFEITFNSENYIATNFQEKISLHSHLNLLNYVKKKDEYLSVLKREYDVQVASREQFNESIKTEEIENITLEKGGCALLLCSYYLDNDTTENEKKAWYYLGQVIQFVNDLFDIYRDLQSGLQTIPNRLTSIAPFRNYYESLVNQLKTELSTIKGKDRAKLSLKISLMGIAALGIIAIEQLEKLEEKQGNLFNLKNCTRNDLVVDMDKKHNLWKWLKIVYKLSKN